MIYNIFRIFGIVLGYPLQLLFFKRKTYYEDKRSTHLYHGGKLIISNHFNILDYVMSCFVVFPRKLTAIASEMPFKSRITRFGMKFFGAIEANRETRSMKFMDEAAAVIRGGGLVQIFPEGRNTPDGKIHDFKQSYLVIAHRAGAPIVPIVTDGNYGLFRRTHVMIGREIDVSPFFAEKRPTREELRAANEFVHAKVLALRAELEAKKQKKG
ncbi:MAG: 1-acyl-sn-glycerol-3-phosphate acyltransferase [Clostridia bacterium]|nr:1-acyl-sn-glycerol-3-phosphate acyltransferase [Clostridia bacterium]